MVPAHFLDGGDGFGHDLAEVSGRHQAMHFTRSARICPDLRDHTGIACRDRCGSSLKDLLVEPFDGVESWVQRLRKLRAEAQVLLDHDCVTVTVTLSVSPLATVREAEKSPAE